MFLIAPSHIARAHLVCSSLMLIILIVHPHRTPLCVCVCVCVCVCMCVCVCVRVHARALMPAQRAFRGLVHNGGVGGARPCLSPAHVLVRLLCASARKCVRAAAVRRARCPIQLRGLAGSGGQSGVAGFSAGGGGAEWRRRAALLGETGKGPALRGARIASSKRCAGSPGAGD